MDRELVYRSLALEISNILEISGVDQTPLSEVECPADVPGFKSEDWPYVMDELAETLGINIPTNMNIFLEKICNSKRKRRTEEVIDILISCAKRSGR